MLFLLIFFAFLLLHCCFVQSTFVIFSYSCFLYLLMLFLCHNYSVVSCDALSFCLVSLNSYCYFLIICAFLLWHEIFCYLLLFGPFWYPLCFIFSCCLSSHPFLVFSCDNNTLIICSLSFIFSSCFSSNPYFLFSCDNDTNNLYS